MAKNTNRKLEEKKELDEYRRHIVISLGKTVREFRLEKKLTQEKLAAKLCISLRYVQEIESGEKVLTYPIYLLFSTFFGRERFEQATAKHIEIAEQFLTRHEEKDNQ